MKQSLTYYITLFVLRIKGIKKDFSKDPIDFKKIRREDVRYPQGKILKQNQVRNFKVLNTTITEVSRDPQFSKLLLFVHGGAFISGPAKHHWDTVKELAKQTNYTIWLCDYPKAPENKISTISENIDLVYHAALEKYPAKQITLIGDSVGGTLITALMQRLVQKKMEVPLKIILISPVMNAAMSNPSIDEIDKTDPMLSKIGVLSAKKMCAGNTDLNDNMISPIHGSFSEFPPTVLFLAENDITYPDQQLTVQKLVEAKADLKVITGKNMPHIWPFLPVMSEAKTALREIVNLLNGQTKKMDA